MASQDTNIGLAKYLDGIGLEAVEKANPTKEVFGRAIEIFECEPKIYMAPPTDQASFSEKVGKLHRVTMDEQVAVNHNELGLLHVQHCIVGVDEDHKAKQRLFIRENFLRVGSIVIELSQSFSKTPKFKDLKKK